MYCELNNHIKFQNMVEGQKIGLIFETAVLLLEEKQI